MFNVIHPVNMDLLVPFWNLGVSSLVFKGAVLIDLTELQYFFITPLGICHFQHPTSWLQCDCVELDTHTCKWERIGRRT